MDPLKGCFRKIFTIYCYKKCLQNQNGIITFSKYVYIHVVSAQKRTRRIEDSNINSGYLWVVGLQKSFLLCGFLVFSKLYKMYMCYFHYSKQIIFLKRKTKKQSSSSYFVAFFDKEVLPNSPRTGTEGYFSDTNCANSKPYSQNLYQEAKKSVTFHPVWGTPSGTAGSLPTSFYVQGFLIMLSLGPHKQC